MSELNTQPNKRRLGRGLDSLFTLETEAPPAPELPKQSPSGAPLSVQIDKLFPNQDQPRKRFSKEELAELAASIKEKGIIQPILAKPKGPGKFEIIAGERRWRAAQQAGLHEVPVFIKDASPREALEMALIENIQRVDLNPMEEAEAFGHLQKTFNLTQQELAEKVGKERATVANSMRLLGLATEGKEAVRNQLITAGHAKALLSLENQQEQVELLREVIKHGLSVRTTEALAKKQSEAGPAVSNEFKTENQKHILRVQEDLQRTLGTKTKIRYKAGRGRIEISFFSDDELNGLLERLKGNE